MCFAQALLGWSSGDGVIGASAFGAGEVVRVRLELLMQMRFGQAWLDDETGWRRSRGCVKEGKDIRSAWKILPLECIESRYATKPLGTSTGTSEVAKQSTLIFSHSHHLIDITFFILFFFWTMSCHNFLRVSTHCICINMK
jgi:hypothetical protein